jgi:hypothetical protein
VVAEIYEVRPPPVSLQFRQASDEPGRECAADLSCPQRRYVTRRQAARRFWPRLRLPVADPRVITG